MEHYHVLVANVIFTCGFAAQRSTFALCPMSLLSQPGSKKPRIWPKTPRKQAATHAKPSTGGCAAGCQL